MEQISCQYIQSSKTCKCIQLTLEKLYPLVERIVPIEEYCRTRTMFVSPFYMKTHPLLSQLIILKSSQVTIMILFISFIVQKFEIESVKLTKSDHKLTDSDHQIHTEKNDDIHYTFTCICRVIFPLADEYITEKVTSLPRVD
jgi:hypothetical protein